MCILTLDKLDEAGKRKYLRTVWFVCISSQNCVWFASWHSFLLFGNALFYNLKACPWGLLLLQWLRHYLELGTQVQFLAQSVISLLLTPTLGGRLSASDSASMLESNPAELPGPDLGQLWLSWTLAEWEADGRSDSVLTRIAVHFPAVSWLQPHACRLCLPPGKDGGHHCGEAAELLRWPGGGGHGGGPSGHLPARVFSARAEQTGEGSSTWSLHLDKCLLGVRWGVPLCLGMCHLQSENILGEWTLTMKHTR